jgi:hypothetical protein
VIAEVIAVEEAVTTTDAVAVAVATVTEDLAAQTTSPSAAETGIATAMVGMVEAAVMVEAAATTAAHGSVGTRATATTIRDSEGDTRPIYYTALVSCTRVCQRFTSLFLRLVDPFLLNGGYHHQKSYPTLDLFDHSIGR